MRITRDELYARHTAVETYNTQRWNKLCDTMSQAVTAQELESAKKMSAKYVEKYSIDGAGMFGLITGHEKHWGIRYDVVALCVRLMETFCDISVGDPTKICRRCVCGSYGLKHILEGWLDKLTAGKQTYVSNGEGILAVLMFKEMHPSWVHVSKLRDNPIGSWDPNIDAICFAKWFVEARKYPAGYIDELDIKDVSLSDPLAWKIYQSLPQFGIKGMTSAHLGGACMCSNEELEKVRAYFGRPDATMEEICLDELFFKGTDGLYYFKPFDEVYVPSRINDSYGYDLKQFYSQYGFGRIVEQMCDQLWCKPGARKRDDIQRCRITRQRGSMISRLHAFRNK